MRLSLLLKLMLCCSLLRQDVRLHADAETAGLEFSLFIAGDIEPSFRSLSPELVGALPQPLTRICLYCGISYRT